MFPHRVFQLSPRRARDNVLLFSLSLSFSQLYPYFSSVSLCWYVRVSLFTPFCAGIGSECKVPSINKNFLLREGFYEFLVLERSFFFRDLLLFVCDDTFFTND